MSVSTSSRIVDPDGNQHRAAEVQLGGGSAGTRQSVMLATDIPTSLTLVFWQIPETTSKLALLEVSAAPTSRTDSTARSLRASSSVPERPGRA